jgi:putative peptidoglycan lipid II flippase
LGIGRSSLFFSIGSILSRFSGLARDSIVAGVFGASAAMDAFLIAFRIPNLLRDLLAEGALSSAFTKVYSETSVQDQAKARHLLENTSKWVGIVAGLISFLGILCAPLIVDLMTIGGSLQNSETIEAVKAMATVLTRILFPFLPIVAIGAVIMGALQQHGFFFVTGVSSIGLNLGFIAGALLLGPFAEYLYGVNTIFGAYINITGLAVGVVLGGLCSLLFEAVILVRQVLRHRKSETPLFSWPKLTPETKKILILMAPAAIAAGAGPINVIINTNFAASLPAGSITWLNYSFRLLQLPVGIIGVAIASAALPELARQLALSGGSFTKEVVERMQQALGLAIWLMAPCFVILATRSEELVNLFFRHFRFSAVDAAQTAQALTAYSFALLPYGIIKVLTAFYFATERTSYALKATGISLVVSIAANSMLVGTYGHIGLATATACSLSTNAFVLLFGLRRHSISWEQKKVLKSTLYVALATLLAVCLISVSADLVNELLTVFNFHNKLRALTDICISGLITATVFGVALRFGHNLGLGEVKKLLKKKGT